uniref:Palmitoyltransferase n=1 Tax=Alexandrium monilatum TaxID=311494 RepID=A0A7S4QDA7_9DINO
MDPGPQVVGRQEQEGEDQDNDDAPDDVRPRQDKEEEEFKELVNGEDPEKQRSVVYVSDHGISWQGRRYVWLGRVCVMRIGSRAAFVGPHWYCTLLMFSVIIGVGSTFIFRIAKDLHWVHLVGGALSVFCSSEALLRCAFIDPGILQPHPNSPGGNVQPMQMLPARGERRCSACMITQPKGAMHCEFCHVCVAGWDHHCPWMGKCIGQSNLNAFYAFLCTSLTSLAYILIITVLSA